MRDNELSGRIDSLPKHVVEHPDLRVRVQKLKGRSKDGCEQQAVTSSAEPTAAMVVMHTRVKGQ